MTARFIDSFDHYTDLTKKYTGVSGSATAITAGTGRRGTSGLSLGPTTNVAYVFKTFDAQRIWTVGFSFNYTVLPLFDNHLAYLKDAGSVQLALNILTGGAITINVGFWGVLATSDNTLAINTPYYIEWKSFIADDGTGYSYVKVNGSIWASVENDWTNNTANVTADSIEFNWGNSSTAGIVHIDDLYILDGNAPDNDFWGDTAIDAVVPTGDGSVLQWTPQPAGTHYTSVDDATPDLADYIDTNTAGNLDTFTFISPAGVNIKAIQQNIWAETASGTANINGAVVSSGSTYFSENLAINTTDKAVTAIWPIDPSTASTAWTPTTINSAEFGVSLA